MHDTVPGAWSMVFVGCEGAPPDRAPDGLATGPAYTSVAAAPITAEKPFVTLAPDGVSCVHAMWCNVMWCTAMWCNVV